ncbi:uncharacterized protein METZ01_LOCUS159629 [marine metagenome]|uniref:Uncharacterized protein n=1 Tax=marine metagenome TaxID=408172 RepID=A0A382AZ19_9ZZZZ
MVLYVSPSTSTEAWPILKFPFFIGDKKYVYVLEYDLLPLIHEFFID